jgi:hypothetical protein
MDCSQASRDNTIGFDRFDGTSNPRFSRGRGDGAGGHLAAAGQELLYRRPCETHNHRLRCFGEPSAMVPKNAATAYGS